MAFISVDDLVSEISEGKIHRSDWQYRTDVAAAAASVSVGSNLSSYPGMFGTPNTFPGTALSWVTCNNSTGNGTQIFGIPHGGNVSPDTKHLISVSAFAQVGPPTSGGTLVLVDLQGYWPGINHGTTSTQTLTGTPSLRYDDGIGCRLYLVTTAPPATGTYNINCSYVNQSDGNSVIPAIAGRSAPVIGQISSAFPGGAPSLYFPLVDGDIGVKNVNNIQFTTARAGGTAALCLAKPIVSLPLVAAVNNTNEKEFVYQTPSMPIIKDEACLVWLYFSGTGGTGAVLAANTGFTGHIETAWG